MRRTTRKPVAAAAPEAEDNLSKPGIKALIEQIEAAKTRIADERDKLRDLVEQAAAIIESCDDAERGLESAADSLSELL